MLLNNLIAELEKKHGCKAGCVILDADTGEYFASYDPEYVFKSASLIKTPIMLYALSEVEKGVLSLDTVIPVEDRHCVGDHDIVIKDGRNVTLSMLLEHMITKSNNTATNVLIDYFTMDKVNAYSQMIGLKDTVLRRHMLDYEAARQGRENRTTALDNANMYLMLHKGETLSPFQCEVSLPILMRQYDKELIMFHNPRQKAAHKTGGLFDIAHDAGILYGEKRNLVFAALCTAPSDATCIAFLQELSPRVLELL